MMKIVDWLRINSYMMIRVQEMQQAVKERK